MKKMMALTTDICFWKNSKRKILSSVEQKKPRKQKKIVRWEMPLATYPEERHIFCYSATSPKGILTCEERAISETTELSWADIFEKTIALDTDIDKDWSVLETIDPSWADIFKRFLFIR